MAKNENWLPCQSCGKSAFDWIEDDEGVRWAVTLPYGESVRPGEEWTCRVCNKGVTKKNAV